MSTHKPIQTKNAPEAIGPYSQAIQVGNSLYISGQLGINPATNQIVPGGIVPETNQALNNIKAILKQANFSLTDVVQVQVFLTDMNDFPNMNKAYAKFFMEPFPTRAAIEVSKLPKNAKIEITATAAKQS